MPTDAQQRAQRKGQAAVNTSTPLDADGADPWVKLWPELSAPFPADLVEKLPKPLRRDDQDRGRCETGSKYTADGHACHGWHSRAVHLDYIGHAGITDRLNTVLGPAGWDFQPYAETPDGWPAMGSQFYAKLTILGVTKWDLAADFKGPQEAYGDALRRCAMRFGIGTYLWSKSEQALAKARGEEPEAQGDGQPPTSEQATMTPAQYALRHTLDRLPEDIAAMVREWWPTTGLPGLYDLSDEHVATIDGHIQGLLAHAAGQAPTPDPQ